MFQSFAEKSLVKQPYALWKLPVHLNLGCSLGNQVDLMTSQVFSSKIGVQGCFAFGPHNVFYIMSPFLHKVFALTTVQCHESPVQGPSNPHYIKSAKETIQCSFLGPFSYARTSMNRVGGLSRELEFVASALVIVQVEHGHVVSQMVMTSLNIHHQVPETVAQNTCYGEMHLT